MQQNATENNEIEDDAPDLTPTQQIVLTAILEGSTYVSAAEKAKINRCTIYRWLESDIEFQLALNRGKNERLRAVENRILDLAQKAVDVIEEALDDGDRKVAISVAKGLGLLDGKQPNIGITNRTDLLLFPSITKIAI